MITDRNLWITWIQSLWNIWRTIWFGHLIRICTGHHSLCAMWSKNHSQAACDALNCFVNSSTHCTMVGWKIMSGLQKCNLTLISLDYTASYDIIITEKTNEKRCRREWTNLRCYSCICLNLYMAVWVVSVYPIFVPQIFRIQVRRVTADPLTYYSPADWQQLQRNIFMLAMVCIASDTVSGCAYLQMHGCMLFKTKFTLFLLVSIEHACICAHTHVNVCRVVWCLCLFRPTVHHLTTPQGKIKLLYRVFLGCL